MFGMWFVITIALGGVANHVLNPSAGRGMGYLAIAVTFGFAFAFPVRAQRAARMPHAAGRAVPGTSADAASIC